MTKQVNKFLFGQNALTYFFIFVEKCSNKFTVESFKTFFPLIRANIFLFCFLSFHFIRYTKNTSRVLKSYLQSLTFLNFKVYTFPDKKLSVHL